MSDELNQLQTDVPSITVLMSVFNGECWLSEAIESVLNQSFTDFEFIIVDDGSIDNSLEIIRRFQEKDSRIIIIRKPNTGLADSLNHGLQSARGEWIARLDADDICEPTRLKKQIALAQTNPNIVFVGSGLTIINDAGLKKAIHLYPRRHSELLRQLQRVDKFPAHSSAFYQTKAIRAVSGYRQRIKRAQDWDLWLRLTAVGEMSCIREPLIQLRHHDKQISHDEAGQLQLFYSRVGQVSYWLRRSGAPDPVDADEIVFKAFLAWLQFRLTEEGFFVFHAHSVLLRSNYQAADNLFSNIMRLTVNCMKNSVFTVRFIQERILGDTLSRQLALEWLQRSNL